ncbi:aldo/keto reductase [Amycolatopsis sp., V23-08]|uniref:Aldo/keto reductase n=1 Tax=Amycolatopsis heterodermiae TaxID=3110235 RepID=A0ABU5R466_9PSEU|nr:aldo/keto reductase [Amycolatopsis sp., V23-08]MEA5360474.1 aldo/keto reductase [Amycolatopsis sp., V23-08]
MAQLGRTGIDVFPLALGGNTFGWTSDEATSHQVLDAFVAGGGNFVDTADGYSAFVPGNSGGESETIIGSWLAARKNRDAVVIGTKVSTHPKFKGLAAPTVAAAADASLTRLGTDRIDVYYAHFDDPKTPLAETAAAFDALHKAGKIRAVALSNYTGARITEWLDIARREGFEPPTVLQPHYNLVTRQPYEREIAPVLEEAGIAAVPYLALASGFLTGKYRRIGGFQKVAPYLSVVGGLLTGKHRRDKQEFGGAARRILASRYFTAAGLAVVDVVEQIAAARDAEMATVAVAWLRDRPGVVAPLASARTAEQLPALLASATFDLTADEKAALDKVSGQLG